MVKSRSAKWIKTEVNIMRRLAKLKEARKVLGNWSDTKMRTKIKTDPTFPAYLIDGMYMVDLDELDTWIESCRIGVAVKAQPKPKRGRPEKGRVNRVFEVNTPGWERPASTG